MGFKTGIGLILLTGMLISGCLPSFKADYLALTANSTGPSNAPTCASCHAYPLHDAHHVYHLRAFNPRESMASLFVKERQNGIVVCMDCHFGSVAHKKYTWYDTLWGIPPDLHYTPEKLPTDPIYRIDGTPGYLPLPVGISTEAATAIQVDTLMDNAAKVGDMLSWMTSLNHMNGKVDVEFSENIVVDTSLSKSAYRPLDQSCSSIECHNAPKKRYRWASLEKRLSGCPTMEHSPDLDSSCGYLPNQEP